MTNDELREWLIKRGYKTAPYSLADEFNACKWYAYKRVSPGARECECNKRSPIVCVFPNGMKMPHGGYHESVMVDVTGKYSDLWWKLQSYSMTVEQCRERLGDIEANLMAAWDALEKK